MRHPDSENSNAQSPIKPVGLFEQAREIFDKMKGEAVRETEIERQRDRVRGPVAKTLLYLTLVAILLAVVTGCYGIYNFPDAPIRPAAQGYVGKTGKPHTQAEYEGFVAWKKTMFIVFPSALVLGFAFGIAETKGRRKGARQSV
jgi:hypothetical protein